VVEPTEPVKRIDHFERTSIATSHRIIDSKPKREAGVPPIAKCRSRRALKPLQSEPDEFKLD
jgi:hypothetical protein